jgi:hypothetical protein
VKRAEVAFEQELAERLFTRSQPLAIQDCSPRRDMCGADMEVDACQMTQRTVLTCQQTDMRIDAVCRRMQRLIEHPVATFDLVLCDLGTNEIERAALPCTPTLNGVFWAWSRRKRAAMSEGVSRNLSPTRTSPA